MSMQISDKQMLILLGIGGVATYVAYRHDWKQRAVTADARYGAYQDQSRETGGSVPDNYYLLTGMDYNAWQQIGENMEARRATALPGTYQIEQTEEYRDWSY